MHEIESQHSAGEVILLIKYSVFFLITFLKIKSSFPQKSGFVMFFFAMQYICHALLFNIAKEKVANLYVLDEHLKQEKGKEKEISSKVWITCHKQHLIFVNYTI